MTTKIGSIQFDRSTKLVLILVLVAMNVMLAVAGVAFILSQQTDVVPVQSVPVVVPPSATSVLGQAIVIPTLPPVWTPTFTPLPTETSVAPTPTLEVSPTKVIKKTGPTATRRPTSTAGPGVATETVDVCVAFPDLCVEVTDEPVAQDTPVPQPPVDDCQRQWLSDEYVPYMERVKAWYLHEVVVENWSFPMIYPQHLSGWEASFDRTRGGFASAFHPGCVETQHQAFVTAQLLLRSALFDFTVTNESAGTGNPYVFKVNDAEGGSAKIVSAFALFETAIQQVQSIAGQ